MQVMSGCASAIFLPVLGGQLACSTDRTPVCPGTGSVPYDFSFTQRRRAVKQIGYSSQRDPSQDENQSLTNPTGSSYPSWGWEKW